MKKLLPLSILLLVGLIIIPGCKSGKKAFKQGNYEEAVYSSLERLKKSPNNNRAKEALQEAYPSLANFYKSRIASLKSNSDPMRWEEILSMYTTLQDIYLEAQRTPGARGVINPQEYGVDQESAKNEVIKSRFRLGKDELAKGYRENAKLAYGHFERVYELDPQRSDAEDLMYKAQELATLFVEVKPIPMHSRTFKLSNQFFESQIMEFLKNETNNPFIQFISSREQKRVEQKPQHILEFVFDDFIVGQGYEKETVINRSKDSVKVGKATIGDSTVYTYATVRAEVHQFRRTIRSSGVLNANIRDGQNATILAQRKFPGTFEYTDLWGFYNGDERALQSDDRKLIKRRSRLPDPPPQDLFIEFTKPIFSQLTSYLIDYYRNY